MCKSSLIMLAVMAVSAVAQNPGTTPVPILRQINSHNDDGSYTYGYEAADGSYKIETKARTGEVRGKYGYYDDAGTLREIEYGANRNGFNPSGTGIQVPPPVVTSNNIQSTNPDDYDDGQYRPGPDEAGLGLHNQLQTVQRVSGSRFSSNLRSLPQAAPAQPQPVQQHNYYQPAEQPQPAYRPVQLPAGVFNGHPARNINLNSGSYSIQY